MAKNGILKLEVEAALDRQRLPPATATPRGPGGPTSVVAASPSSQEVEMHTAGYVPRKHFFDK